MVKTTEQRGPIDRGSALATENQSPLLDDARVTDVGLFHYAASYRAAADALGAVKFSATHPDAPVSFLYVHALELYIKAYLRCAGQTADHVARYRHNLRRLRRHFEARADRWMMRTTTF